MKKTNTHWTNTQETFLVAISADFVLQIKERANSQKELADKLAITKGRVSQTLTNPGNLTLHTMVKYARALGMKVSVVLYEDKDDPENQLGPVHADIFRLCWEEKNRPRDFWAFQRAEPKMKAVARDIIDPGSLNRVVNPRATGVDAADGNRALEEDLTFLTIKTAGD
jgi:DNA-binding phage protein